MKHQIRKAGILTFLFGGMIAGVVLLYNYYLGCIPDAINLKACSEQEIDFCVPVSGVIMPSNTPIDFSREFTMVTGTQDSYVASLRLFGFLPYKEVEIRIVEDKMLIPVGTMAGIYVETEGIMVIDTGSFQNEEGETCAPAEDILMQGDYILSVDGETITRKKELIEFIEESNGRELELRIMRDDEEMTVYLTPEKNMSGEYKAGIWVRDSAQGVGTLTYVDLDGNFGALGHGITDGDTGKLIEINQGQLYSSQIFAIQKGVSGHPGEITGSVHYVQDNIIGEIGQNSYNGIFGNVSVDALNLTVQPMEIGYCNEIHKGPARILCDITGEPCFYDIYIENINISSQDNKGLVIRVTDPELLELTGGIVQGMSGSPIIQDGKLIGAVTHVLIRDSTKGYGIFIENMLEQSMQTCD